MGFKVDTSFLRFLTMGALGVRKVTAELKALGFEPIELERYCSSNKLWTTKVKRLRVPDLLCVRTGLRVEVRAKSDLQIKMSDAPNNPDRVWDAGMRDNDVIAFIACRAGAAGPIPAEHGVYFAVDALRASVGSSRLGPPKSASEGAERDRTWPAIIPTRPGKIIAVDTGRLTVLKEGDGEPPKRQTYTLNGKHPYFTPPQSFAAAEMILAGAPPSLADMTAYLQDRYNPLDFTSSENPMDRYAAVKALRFRLDLHKSAISILEALLVDEVDTRVALEAAGSAAAMGSKKGEAKISEILWGQNPQMSMEAILILTELPTTFAQDALRKAASSEHFQGDERRQAAIWGLGKAGHHLYKDILPFLGDAEPNVAYHAIAAFGIDTPKDVIEKLVSELTKTDSRRSAAASEALRAIGNFTVLECLLAAVKIYGEGATWLVATIGRLPKAMVREHLKGTPLLARLEPMLLLAPGGNWMAGEDVRSDLLFLEKQNL